MVVKKQQKMGRLLISMSHGDENKCGGCGAEDIYMVVHDNITITDLKPFKEMLEPNQKGALMQAYPRQSYERYLCKRCYEANFKFNEAMMIDGSCVYTSMYPENRKRRLFYTVEEAVEKFK